MVLVLTMQRSLPERECAKMLKLPEGEADMAPEGDIYVPSGDTGHASLRAMLAGLGTAGMLVGAVAAVAALTVGVVAFSGWPGSPDADRRPAVTLGGEDGAPSRVALAARNAIASSATPGATVSGRSDGADGSDASAGGATASPRQSSAGATTPASSNAGGAAPAAESTQSADANPGAQEKERRRPVADATDLTGRELGGAVKDGGAAIGGAARPVSAPAAEALTTVSKRVGEAVTAATKAITDVLRGMPNRPPPGG